MLIPLVTALLSLLAAAALWLLYEVIGQMVGDLLRMVFAPVVRPIERVAGALLNAWTLRLLWLAAVASLVAWPFSLRAPGTAVHILGSIAFIGLTPLALMATFAWRARYAGSRLHPASGSTTRRYGGAERTQILRERWNR